MGKVFRDMKVPAAMNDKVKAAVSGLTEALQTVDTVPKDAVFQEVIVSHPGNADSMIHVRTVTVE
jgi:hypothetical protein